MATTDQLNAGFDAAKSLLTQIIEAKAGMFASTIEGDIKDEDILTLVKAVAAAIEGAK